MKKYLILLLIGVIAMGLLTACAFVAQADTVTKSEAEVPVAARAAEELADKEAGADQAAAAAQTEVGPANCEAGYEDETIHIHQHAGREGPIAAILGQGFAYATRDAVAEINAAGGVCGARLEVIYRETQYNVEQEIAAYEEARAFAPKPIAILTYNSGATAVLKDRVVEDEIVHFAGGLHGEAIYNPADGYTVAVFPIYSDQFAGFLTWLRENWAEVKPAGTGDEIVVGVIGWANAFGAAATTPEALAVAEALGVTVLPLEEQPISPVADVTGQIQNLLLGGANVIYNQNLSFSTAQVISTIHALGAWDSLLVGGVNFSMNVDVINFLGENAALADGYYAVYPHLSWNDSDAPGVQRALANFEANGYSESEKGISYLAVYGEIYALATALEHTINMVGFENLSGATLLAAMEDLGAIHAAGLYEFDLRDGNRAPRRAQIRQARFDDGQVEFVVVEDFFELPDTRPVVK